MTTVDRLNIEITANGPLLDRSMRDAERRVDVGATRMAKSVDRVGRSGGRMGGAITNRLLMTPNRLIGGFLGLGAISGGIRGYADAIQQSDTSWQNIALNSAKHLPILSSIVMAAEAYYEKLYDTKQLLGQMTQMDIVYKARFGLDDDLQQALRDSRISNARTDRAKRRAVYENEMHSISEFEKTMRKRIKDSRSQPDVEQGRIAALEEVLRNMREAALREMKGQAQASFDTMQTVFGPMRIANRFKGQQEEPATEEKQEDTLKAVNDILSLLNRVLGTGFMPFA